MTATYRICRNSSPHTKDWWTVEKAERGWFGRVRWRAVKGHIGWDLFLECRFASEAEAQAWIDEDKKPSVHTCGEPQ